MPSIMIGNRNFKIQQNTIINAANAAKPIVILSHFGKVKNLASHGILVFVWKSS